MQTWRLLDTPPMTAAENMAMDETLLELKGEGRSPNTIRFLQFSPRAVLVGFHQAIAEEIRTGYCRANRIDVNRRITGGGAIFFDENQLGWEVFCDKAFFNTSIPNAHLFKALCEPVVAALALLNINAEFRPRNDIEVNGRKISGTGGTEADGAFMFQGTMLVDFDADTMLRALRIPVEKLKAKEIDSVKDRVTCLKWELGDAPSLAGIKQAIKLGFEKCLDIKLELGGLTAQEQKRFEEKLTYFRSTRWVDSVKPRFQKRETVQAAYKAPAGMVRTTLVINLPQKRLKDIYITGDFLSFPGRALYDLEAELRGAPLDRDRLHGIIRNYFDQGRIIIPGLSFEDFLKPLDQCLEKVEISKYGIPLAHCNLISVANGSFEEVIRRQPSVLLLPYCAKLTECDLRYEKGCKICGEAGCSIGPAWVMGRGKEMKVISIVSFEDLWDELMRMKAAGVCAYIGCCCQPFFAKHVDDFKKSGLPGILLDIDNTTCYDLDQAKEAYAGKFDSQTKVNLELLQTVLNVTQGVAMTIARCDVLVVGAGPAGSSAALAASRRGARVLLVERRRQVGLPVQCAEYIPAMLKGQLGLGAGYVVQKIEGMRTFVPGQAVKETVAPGYVIRRELFDRTLVAAAQAAGAELRCATRATAMHPDGSVTLSPRDGPATAVRPKVIIGADGPHSTIGRQVGAVNRHLLPGVQMTLPLAAPLAYTEIYFDPEFVAGYGWLFPKGKVANIGLGMLRPTRGRPSLRKVLDGFIRRLEAEGKICGAPVAYAAGWIPAEPVRRAVYGNVLLAGDAAGQTHPITGAGIFAAVACGQMAGKWAARAAALADNDLLAQYDVQWQDLFAETQQRAYRRRVKMESEWEDFGDIIESCWVAFRKYYEDSG